MHYLYRYVCILNVFFICVYGQLSAIKNLLCINETYKKTYLICFLAFNAVHTL